MAEAIISLLTFVEYNKISKMKFFLLAACIAIAFAAPIEDEDFKVEAREIDEKPAIIRDDEKKDILDIDRGTTIISSPIHPHIIDYDDRLFLGGRGELLKVPVGFQHVPIVKELPIDVRKFIVRGDELELKRDDRNDITIVSPIRDHLIPTSPLLGAPLAPFPVAPSPVLNPLLSHFVSVPSLTEIAKNRDEIKRDEENKRDDRKDILLDVAAPWNYVSRDPSVILNRRPVVVSPGLLPHRDAAFSYTTSLYTPGGWEPDRRVIANISPIAPHVFYGAPLK